MEKRAPFRFFPECRGTCPPSVRARFGRVLGSAPASTDRDLRGFQSFGNLGGLYIRGNVSVGGAFIVVGSKGRRREVAPRFRANTMSANTISGGSRSARLPRPVARFLK